MSTYNARVPAAQQYQLIMECRSRGCKWAPNAQTVAIEKAIDILDKIPQVISDLKYYLDTNEESGVVSIPKFAVEKIIASLN